MAFRDIQGFDNMSTQADFEMLTTGYGITGALTFTAGVGKVSGTAMTISSGVLNRTANSGSTNSTGFWFKPGATLATTLVEYNHNLNGSTGYVSCRIAIDTDGSIKVYGQGNGLISTIFPAGTIVADEWYYFAESSTSASNSGSVTVRINDQTASASGDMKVSVLSTSYWHLKANSTYLIDDLVTTNDTTYYNYQNIIVAHLKPTSDRAQADFTPLGAGAGYEEIDEDVSDEDTSYISASTVGAASEFELGPLASDLVSVLGIRITTVAAREGTGGTNNLETSIHTSSGTEVVADSQTLVDGSYTASSSSLILTNPDTATGFTLSDVNGLYIRTEVV